MAARRGGLGKGLDGLFPIYNAEENVKEKTSGREENVKPKAGISKKGKSTAAGSKKTPSAEKKTVSEEKTVREKNVREEMERDIFDIENGTTNLEAYRIWKS